jgi:hypothetical protein
METLYFCPLTIGIHEGETARGRRERGEKEGRKRMKRNRGGG